MLRLQVSIGERITGIFLFSLVLRISARPHLSLSPFLLRLTKPKLLRLTSWAASQQDRDIPESQDQALRANQQFTSSMHGTPKNVFLYVGFSDILFCGCILDSRNRHQEPHNLDPSEKPQPLNDRLRMLTRSSRRDGPVKPEALFNFRLAA